MLFQDEVVSKVLSGAGQVLLTPADLRFDDRLIERDFFVPVLREYQKYRPNVKKLDTEISVDGIGLPSDCLHVISLFFKSVTRVDLPFESMRVQPKVLDHQYWQVLDDGCLYAPVGFYRMEYAAEFTISKVVEGLRLFSLIPGTKSYEFYMPAKIAPGTVSFSDGTRTMVETTQGTLAGALGTGTVDYTTLKVTLTLTTAPTAASFPVLGYFKSVNPYVKELSVEDEIFVDLFAARMLVAYGMAKSVMRIEGLPVDITVDDMLSYGKERETVFTTRADTCKKWWLF